MHTWAERLRSAGREAALALFFLVLAAIATRPLVLDLGRRTLSGPDPVIDLWTVHWLTSHALEPSQIFEGNIFRPFPHAVLHSDLSLGTAVLLLPLRPFVHDPVPLYNLGVLLALSFGGWAFCLLVRGLTGQIWAGILGGVLAAFGSHQLFHVYHLNLLSIGWLALLLLALHRLLVRPSAGAVVLAGASFALSALSSGYYAVAAVLLSLLFAALHPRILTGRKLAAAAAAMLLGGLLIAPYVKSYVELGEESSLRRPIGMSVRMAFAPQRDLGSRALVYRDFLGEQGEVLFPGLITLLLAPLALWRRRPEARFYLASALMLIVVSFGPMLQWNDWTLSLPYRFLFALPLLNGMRHPYTFAAVASLCMAVLAGLGWSSLKIASRPWAGPAIVVLACLETLGPGVAVRAVAPGVPEAYERLAQLPAGVALELLPFESEAPLWAARHGLPVANGNGAFTPPQTGRLENQMRAHWLDQPPGDVDESLPTKLLLGYFDVRYLIVDTTRPGLDRLAEAFDASTRYRLLVTCTDGRRIYELQRDPG